MQIGILGPSGSFSEVAGLQYVKNGDQAVLMSSIDELIFQVEAGLLDRGIVPIENSVEGSVNTTVDTLIFDVDLYIQSEYNLPVRETLMSKGTKETIHTILSHSQPIGQCRKYLHQNFSHCDIQIVSSTSEAARIAAEKGECYASIGHISCAEIYGLQVLDQDIQDKNNNVTKFVEVSKNNTATPFEGCKMSIAFSTMHKPGGLHHILDIIALWEVNMTKIESRPSKDALGQYIFFVDLDAPACMQDLEDALTMLKRKTTFFKILGCYKICE